MLKWMRESGRQRRGLETLIRHLPQGIDMAEVGCYRGESAAMFLGSGRIGTFFGVDIWEGEVEPAEKDFDRTVLPFRSMVEKIKAPSREAAKRILDGSLDFVYIDAAHDYASVLEDIRIWRKKVRRGGMIGGHDFNFHLYPGVVHAVHREFFAPNFVFEDSSWLVTDMTRTRRNVPKKGRK